MHLLLDVYNIYLMKAKRFVYLKSLSDIDMRAKLCSLLSLLDVDILMWIF